MTSKLTSEPLFAEVHNVPDDYEFTDAELDRIIAGDMFTPRQAAIMARELKRKRACLGSEPAAFTDDRNLHHIAMGRETSLIWGEQNSEAGDVPLYRHAQPATVVEREPIAWLNDAYLARGVVDGEAGSEDAGPGYIPVYREAGPQPAPVVQCPFPCGWDNLNKLAIQDAALVARGLVEGEPTTEVHRQAAIANSNRLLKVISACRAAMLSHSPDAGNKVNSQEIPDGWALVPKEATPEMLQAAWTLHGIHHQSAYRAMIAAAPKPED